MNGNIRTREDSAVSITTTSSSCGITSNGTDTEDSKRLTFIYLMRNILLGYVCVRVCEYFSVM